MKIAFILLVHKDPTYLHRLVSTLNADNTCILIHVDRGTQEGVYIEMQNLLSGFLSVYWLPRVYSHWGSWGLVQASLNGLKKARELNCDYSILLSGQDYPVKSLSSLTTFLEENHGTTFLQFHLLPSNRWPPDGASRYSRWHFNLDWKDSSFRKWANRILNRIFNTLFPDRTLPNGLRPFGGWQWWCLHRDCVIYILDYTAEHHRVVEFFKYVRIPDEMYFHTVLLNSPLRSSISNHLLTYADWDGPPFPRILMQSDFEKIRNNGSFFARKFDPDVDAEILDRVDHDLLL